MPRAEVRGRGPSRTRGFTCCAKLCSGSHARTPAWACAQAAGLGFVAYGMGVSALLTYVGSVIALQLSGWPLPELAAVYPVDWLLAAAAAAWFSAIVAPALSGCTALLAYVCCEARTEASRAGKARMATSLALAASVWQAAAGTVVLVLGTDFLSTAKDRTLVAGLALSLPLAAALAVWPLAVLPVAPVRPREDKTTEAASRPRGLICAVGVTATAASVAVAALLTLQVALVHVSGSSGPWLEHALGIAQPLNGLAKRLVGSAVGDRGVDL